MAHPDEAPPSSALDSAKPAPGQPEPLPAVKPDVTHAQPPAAGAESVQPAPVAQPADTSVPAVTPPASPAASPVPAAVPTAPQGTVPMDPGAIAAPPVIEEPRTEYHAPHDPVPDPAYDPHHDQQYHDHHHGPGADPYHHEYQYDEHYHHHGSGAGDAHSGGSTALTTTGGGGDDTIDPLFDEKPGEGGPVKPFLEHLEDLRWVIIKVAVALIIGMVICLFAADRIVAIFKWPLERAAHLSTDPRQHVSVMFGSKEMINFKVTPLSTNQPPAATNFVAWPIIPTNRYVELEVVPFADGTNQLLTLRVRTVGAEVPPDKAKPIIYKGIAAPFINSLHIAFFGGLLLAFPFVGFFLVQFILPALREKERKYFIKAMLPATLLFAAGVSLCYFLIMPLALRAADQYALWMGVDIPFLEAGEYFGFCIKFMIGMGAGFEMPVILLALVKIGLLDYAKLAGFRRYMILINLVLGALLTTPEVLTQVAMFIPLQCLYELTIWIAWYWEQEDRAFARRRLAMVIVAFVLFIVLCYLAWRYGWPWVSAQMRPPL